MSNPGLCKTYLAGGTINPRRFVKFSADGTVVQASAAADDVIGVAACPDAVASGERLDVYRDGLVPVDFGGTVTRGVRVMSDADGKAVAHTGSEDRIYEVVIAGGSAGTLTVTGILTTDRLVSVLRLDIDATAANTDLDDLTSEFSISAADTITNAGGSATTGDKLKVLYERSGGGNTPCGRNEQAAVSGDIGLVKLT
jgi:hypothetical protein